MLFNQICGHAPKVRTFALFQFITSEMQGFLSKYRLRTLLSQPWALLLQLQLGRSQFKYWPAPISRRKQLPRQENKQSLTLILHELTVLFVPLVWRQFVREVTCLDTPQRNTSTVTIITRRWDVYYSSSALASTYCASKPHIARLRL